jgi:hypothetical protein
VVADLEISREDFQKNTDVIPVSDPHIFSETQRMAQMQAVLSLADKHPDQFNMNKVLARSLKQMKIPNINELMKDVPAPEQRTSADENAAMLIGQPAYAYMQQDHIAHIQDHLQFAMNPFLGQSPFADPNYLNNLIEHIKQHMTLWYLNRSNGYVAQSRGGKPVDNYDDPLLTGTIDQLYTAVGAHVGIDTKEVFGQFAPAFQALIQQAQQRKQAQKQTLPPDAQVVHDTNMAETQRKTQEDQARLQLDTQKLQMDMQKHLEDNKTKIAIENAKLTHQTITDIATTPMPETAPTMGAPTAEMPQPQGVPNVNI